MRNQMLRWDGDDLYWSELRPYEAGRIVVCRRAADGTIADVTPQGFNARSRVHEYGGGHYAVNDGTGYFTNFKDQRLYRQGRPAPPPATTPPARTPDPGLAPAPARPPALPGRAGPTPRA